MVDVRLVQEAARVLKEEDPGAETQVLMLAALEQKDAEADTRGCWSRPLA